MKIRKKEEQPQVFAMKKGEEGWKVSRRGFLSGAAVAGTALLIDRSKKTAEADPFPAFKCPQVTAHTDAVTCLAFSTNGKFLYSGSNDNKLKVWDVSKQGLVKVLSNHSADLNVLAVSANGKFLLSGSDDNNVLVWKLFNHSRRKTFSRHKSDIVGAAFAPDSKSAFSVDKDGNIMHWKVPNGSLVSEWKADSSTYCLAVSPNGDTLATGHWKTISLWSLRQGEVGKLLAKFGNFSGNLSGLAFSDNSKTLLSGSAANSFLKIWSIPDGGPIKTINSAGKKVYSLVISDDGKYAASGGKTSPVKVFSYPDGSLKNKTSLGNVSATSLAISPDNTLVAIGQADGKIRVCSLLTNDHFGCLMDLESNEDTKRGTKYKYRDSTGRWVTVTVPGSLCARPMPAGAVCVCNTVPGSCSCVGHSCSCVGYTCSCQGQCSCVGYGHYWYPN